MKIANLFFIVSIATGSMVSLHSMARAGEAGSAGATSVIMVNGVVTNLSAASAVGKLNASAVTNSSQIETFANGYGSGGVIKVTDAGNTNVMTIGSIESEVNLGVSQANTLTSNAASINAKLGTVVIP